MRQRVRLAQAIAHDPELLVLDEPLNGLDPLVRAETIDLFRAWAAEGKHVILSSHVLQEVDLISDQVVLIANGMIMAEGKIRDVRDEIEEHPSQYFVHCRNASGVAALLFGEDHITEIRLHDDRMGLLVMTRDRERFARAIGRIALDGHPIDGVVPADEDVDALYQYPDRRRVAWRPPPCRLGPGRRGRSRPSSFAARSSPSARCGCTGSRSCRRSCSSGTAWR